MSREKDALTELSEVIEKHGLRLTIRAEKGGVAVFEIIDRHGYIRQLSTSSQTSTDCGCIIKQVQEPTDE